MISLRLKEALSGKLSKDELEKLVSSFDTIGKIVLIEIPRGLSRKQGLIAKAILSTHKNIETVAKKIGGHVGRFRLQKLKAIAGGKIFETELRESGVRMLVDISRCYFSPRLSGERMRIASQVKPGEEVLVMFSGVAPYALVIAKHSRARRIYCVELNPVAHDYAVKNAFLNKLEDKILFFKGDVKKIVPRLKKKFDRIIMPLPRTGASFLGVALSAIKKGGVIHFYDFEKEGEFEKASDKVLRACKNTGKRCRILNVAKVGQQAPRTWRLCVDFTVK